jgi:hypothetical protein
VVIRSNPAFLPKVLSEFHLSQIIELQSLPVSAVDQLALCPVRALSEYIRRTKPLRKSDQLFMYFHTSCLDRPLSKCRLSHWVVDTIQQGDTLLGASCKQLLSETSSDQTITDCTSTQVFYKFGCRRAWACRCVLKPIHCPKQT